MKKLLAVLAILCLLGCNSMTKVKLVKVEEYPFSQRYIIAVVDFENATGAPANNVFIEGVNDSIMTELLSYKRFRIVERKRLAAVLEELDLELAGMAESENAQKIGKLLGADALLFSALKSVMHEKNKKNAVLAYTEDRRTEIIINAKLVLVKTGEILVAAEVPAFFKQDRSVAFGFISSEEMKSEESAVESVMKVAIKQLANDIAAGVPPKAGN
ncbi:CsgG/HfaB family protein [Planctomycetota bacterium]